MISNVHINMDQSENAVFTGFHPHWHVSFLKDCSSFYYLFINQLPIRISQN